MTIAGYDRHLKELGPEGPLLARSRRAATLSYFFQLSECVVQKLIDFSFGHQMH